jgi:hypothetical protein
VRIDVLTLFPSMFHGPLEESMVGRALRADLLDVRLWNPRGFARDRHRTVDDTPYGGGTGMVMRLEPLALCLDSIVASSHINKPRILATSPQGRPLTDVWVRELASSQHLVVICGHYEGIDERLHSLYDTMEYSIGDFHHGNARRRPVDEERSPDNQLARDCSDITEAAVIAVVPVVSQNEYGIFWNDDRPKIAVGRSIDVSFFKGIAVDVQFVATHLYLVSRQAHNPLDETSTRIRGVAKHYNLSPLGSAYPIRDLVDE